MCWEEGLLKQDALLYCPVKVALREKPPEKSRPLEQGVDSQKEKVEFKVI